MAGDSGIGRSAPSDDGTDDIGSELQRAGREVTFGFDAFGGLRSGTADSVMPESCPNCLSTKLLVAIDRHQQCNYFCRDCTMCWHCESGEFRRVNRETCPGCDLATTACFERFEEPAVLRV